MTSPTKRCDARWLQIRNSPLSSLVPAICNLWCLALVVSLHPYFFLRALLLLAGDVEANPGPIQGKEMQYQVSIVVWNCMGLIL